MDPTEPNIEEGNVYKDSRNGTLLELIYVDSNVYILQTESGSHRFGRRRELDENVESNKYEYQPDEKQFAKTSEDDTKEVPFEELDGIGSKGAENLREAGIVTEADVHRSSDESVLSVSWVGQKGLASIREHVDG